jgi:hypothetical protein
VLRASDVPLTIAEVSRRVEQTLGRSVNRASVKATLPDTGDDEQSAGSVLRFHPLEPSNAHG